jgi:hypothetical protein
LPESRSDERHSKAEYSEAQAPSLAPVRSKVTDPALAVLGEDTAGVLIALDRQYDRDPQGIDAFIA